MSVTLLLTCRDSKGSPEVFGRFNYQRSGSSQLSTFPPSSSQTDSTHMEIELHMKYAAARKVFPLGPAAEELWAVFSQVCLSQHCLCTPRAPSSACLAVPGQDHLLWPFCPESCLDTLCWVRLSAERAKSFTRAFPSHVGWSSWAQSGALSPAQAHRAA